MSFQVSMRNASPLTTPKWIYKPRGQSRRRPCLHTIMFGVGDASGNLISDRCCDRMLGLCSWPTLVLLSAVLLPSQHATCQTMCGVHDSFVHVNFDSGVLFPGSNCPLAILESNTSKVNMMPTPSASPTLDGDISSPTSATPVAKLYLHGSVV